MLAQPDLTPGMRDALRLVPLTKEGQHLAAGGYDAWQNGFMGPNRSVLGDIAGALALGRTITDPQWKAAGYGPGGTRNSYAQVSFQRPQILAPTPYRPPSVAFAPVQPINFLSLFGSYQAPSSIATPTFYQIRPF